MNADQELARMRALQKRVDEMQMTADETSRFISYLIGGAPEVVERGLAFIQRIRDGLGVGEAEQ